MNPLVVATTTMRNEQWIFYNNSSAFGQIEKSLNGQNCFEDISIKFKNTELVEIITLCV